MASVPLENLADDVASMLILYVLRNLDRGSLGETHFQKAMFRALLILGQDPRAAGFRPHRYGPYSDLLEEKKEGLKDMGYLVDRNGGVSVSPDVRGDLESVRISDCRDAEGIGTMLRKLKGYTTDELLLMTYCDDERATNGAFIEESEVKEDVYRNRVPTAVGLYVKGKVSMDRAAELAGMGLREFQDELLRRGAAPGS